MCLFSRRSIKGINTNQRGLKTALTQMDSAFSPGLYTCVERDVWFVKRNRDKDSSG